MKTLSRDVPGPAIKLAESPTRFLDGLRGLAALFVLLHHARYLVHEGYSSGYLKHPETYGILGNVVLYGLAVFRTAGEAVLFFFVLSGFVIHLRFARQFHTDSTNVHFGWTQYVKRRAMRLYPPLLLALALTYALDSAGMWMRFPVYGGATLYPLVNATIHAVHDGLTLLGNLAFMMDTYVSSFGTDSPLWSLKFEWWFYMLYPLFSWLSRHSLWGATVTMVAFFGVAHLAPWLLAVNLLRDVGTMMLIWWMGALLAEIYVGRIKVRFKWIAPLALLLPVALFLQHRAIGAEGEALRLKFGFPPWAWGLTFCGIIAVGFAWQERGRSMRWFEKLKWLGDCSYTLYVCHMPILVFISGWLMWRSGGRLPSHFGWLAVSVLGCIGFSYLMHYVTERPITRARRGSALPS